MEKIILALALCWVGATGVFAQQKIGEHSESQDTTTLFHALRHGSFHGHFRSFWMATDNAPRLTDSWAWAAGGGVRYESRAFHRFSLGIGGFFIFNLASSDLTKKDSLTAAQNRYELALFDLENPANRSDIDRLEEFFLRYRTQNVSLTFGKQVLNTPFINPQDGRMRPTGEEGIWAEARTGKHLKIEGGWLYRMSPRGTVRWYSVAQSIGILAQGVQPDGTKSDYAGHLQSAGIGIAGATWTKTPGLKIQVWDQWVDNIFNTALAQADYERPMGRGRKVFVGAQLARQNALADGGNPDPQQAYLQPGEACVTASGQVGLSIQQWSFSINYTQIGGSGRFLMPREWGREPFYTFMARERTEGLGNTRSIVGRLGYANASKRFRAELALGHFAAPDVKNTALNKYGLPAFNQLNLDVRYVFSGALQGADAHLLCVWKNGTGATYDELRYVVNRVNLANYNLLLNYHF